MRAEAARFYVDALEALNAARVPYLVGGAYAFERYTGITRDTKDLDVFVHPRDCRRALEVLARAGYRTEMKFQHWLGKAHSGDDVMDLIFSSGNGCARVDDVWFTHAVDDIVLGVPVRLCPVEESIWSKAFIMERERYDGADVAHLLRARADDLDWPRLLRRFGANWRVLFSHLVLFGFIYPSERARIPSWVSEEMLRRLGEDQAGRGHVERVCNGTLLSRAQYLPDLDAWGYRDGRLIHGTMSEDDVACWTAAIEEAQPKPVDAMQEADAPRRHR